VNKEILYKATQGINFISEFLKKHCEHQTGAITPKAIIYDAYVDLCKSQDIIPANQIKFGWQIYAHYLNAVKSQRQRINGRLTYVYENLCLKNGEQNNGTND